MKLIDLNPEWMDGASADRRGIGVIFDCPCGKCGHRIYIPFQNPTDGGPPYEPTRGWNREGNTFETMTLKPSIARQGHCTWHGFVTNGEIQNA